jgi:hypothetical protein
MTRGPVSAGALDEALPLAKMQGQVLFLRQDPDSPCDFMILNSRQVVFVRVKRSRCLHNPVPDLEAQYRDSVLRLRVLPGPDRVRRELWISSRYGAWRFFEITGSTMEEVVAGGGTPPPK